MKFLGWVSTSRRRGGCGGNGLPCQESRSPLVHAPHGTRTRVPALRGPCPRPLDEGGLSSGAPDLGAKGDVSARGTYVLARLAEVNGEATENSYLPRIFATLFFNASNFSFIPYRPPSKPGLFDSVIESAFQASVAFRSAIAVIPSSFACQ